MIIILTSLTCLVEWRTKQKLRQRYLDNFLQKALPILYLLHPKQTHGIFKNNWKLTLKNEKTKYHYTALLYTPAFVSKYLWQLGKNRSNKQINSYPSNIVKLDKLYFPLRSQFQIFFFLLYSATLLRQDLAREIQ